jgi:hypothetical protein
MKEMEKKVRMKEAKNQGGKKGNMWQWKAVFACCCVTLQP